MRSLESSSRALSTGSAAALGVTSVLVTHDLHEAFDLADRVVVMRRGRVEQVATAEELRQAPAGEYVRELLLRARVMPA